MRAILAAVALLSLQADWQLLGSRNVNFTGDHDAIIVGIRGGSYTAIKLEVGGGDLVMYNIKLTFANGETWSPPTRVNFHQGSWSRTIDLPGSARVIRRMDFWYRSRLHRGTATVRVFGRK